MPFGCEVMANWNIEWRPYWIWQIWRPQWSSALAPSRNWFNMTSPPSVPNFMLVDKCAQCLREPLNVYTINIRIKIHIFQNIHLQPLDWQKYMWYVKLELRFRLLEVKNLCKVLLLDFLCLSVVKLWQIGISSGGHIGFCQYGEPSDHWLWRPQKISSVWPKLHLCQISCL